MDKPKIRVFPPDKPRIIKGLEIVAKANLIADHIRIDSIKVMDCPERGLLCWPPSRVTLSMESREMIKDAVRAEGLAR